MSASLLEATNARGDVRADSAYRSRERESLLKANGWRSRIHRKTSRNRRAASGRVVGSARQRRRLPLPAVVCPPPKMEKRTG